MYAHLHVVYVWDILVFACITPGSVGYNQAILSEIYYSC